MKSNIIKSEIYLKRRPVPAFLFSLLFTGLGQVYNGDFSKGIIFLILRIFSLLSIPLYLLMQGKDFSVFFLLPALTGHLLIWLISPFEALYSALKQKVFNLHWYNSVIFYFLYAVIFSALLAISCLLFPILFSVEKIHNDNMKPGLLKDEFVLVNKYNTGSADIGDIVVFSYGGEMLTGRIIAKHDEIVEIKGNDIFINNTLLSYSVFSKSDAEKMGIIDFEDVFYEINGEKKYAVIFKPEKSSKKKNNKKSVKKQYIVGDDELFVAVDNRIGDEIFNKISNDMIAGIVQGILYSKDLKKVFNRPYLPAK